MLVNSVQLLLVKMYGQKWIEIKSKHQHDLKINICIEMIWKLNVNTEMIWKSNIHTDTGMNWKQFVKVLLPHNEDVFYNKSSIVPVKCI